MYKKINLNKTFKSHKAILYQVFNNIIMFYPYLLVRYNHLNDDCYHLFDNNN